MTKGYDVSESIAGDRSVDAVRARLEGVGQGHLLAFVDELDGAARSELLADIEALPLERVPGLVEEYVKHRPSFEIDPSSIEPPTSVSFDDPELDRDRYRSKGEDVIRAGKLAALTVAGGQGTRLGFDGPKGCFPGGAVSGKPLFGCLADWILAARRKYNAAIPWYVMTSPLNHEATVSFFEEHGHFGLPREDCFFFSQGTMPAFDQDTGRILLAEKHRVATSPDGHGGTLRALAASGALDDMKSRGVDVVSYVQIDNPLARVVDPLFIGLHYSAPGSSAEMSTKAVAKEDPGEKVGVLASVDGRTSVVEYSDLPDDLAAARDDDGKLRLRAGNIAIHLLGVPFIEKLTSGGEVDLPFHRADKKVPHVDVESGEAVSPTEPNAVKLEMFIFDALPKAEGSLVYEVDRVDEFAPIKNAEGTDSPASSRMLQTERAARWLEARGVDVPRSGDGSPECVLEVSPLIATRAEELSNGSIPERVERGAKVVL